ncbi:hypothetical protein BWI93_16510 [Siphonobacter sp. BAB-5385]|nr:hypothetical protein BWI93_16510 [Siphonobacter sp. BAB-5385]
MRPLIVFLILLLVSLSGQCQCPCQRCQQYANIGWDPLKEYPSDFLSNQPHSKILSVDTLSMLTVFVDEDESLQIKRMPTIRTGYGSLHEPPTYRTIGVPDSLVLWRKYEYADYTFDASKIPDKLLKAFSKP